MEVLRRADHGLSCSHVQTLKGTLDRGSVSGGVEASNKQEGEDPS